MSGVDGATVGVAIDHRTESPSVALWIERYGHPTQGTNLSAEAARTLAERLMNAAAEAD